MYNSNHASWNSPQRKHVLQKAKACRWLECSIFVNRSVSQSDNNSEPVRFSLAERLGLGGPGVSRGWGSGAQRPKSANVMIDVKGTIKLNHFEWSQLFDSNKNIVKFDFNWVFVRPSEKRLTC